MCNRSVSVIAVMACGILCSVAWGQASSTSPSAAQSGSQQSMPGMDMSGHDMSNMKGMNMGSASGNDKDAENDASAHVMNSMEGHMDMGPHMKMTALRPPRPGDAARAQQIVEAARKASQRYMDYHAALADGFKIFFPNVPQKMYHFTNYGYGMEAAFHFNPEHPTSLLYEKHGDDYKLIGVMYTAPKRLTEDQLDERVPLSVAQWHEHVNFCRAPADKRGEGFSAHPQFGMRGSISTQEACDAAGGTFIPVVFNWMVHVYPFETDAAKIWSVERQHGDAD
ncbi:MAG: hypothetical protein ABSE44_14325 [Candidatus Sulfotelmatobacter sp.]|jgi:hypothetical protein